MRGPEDLRPWVRWAAVVLACGFWMAVFVLVMGCGGGAPAPTVGTSVPKTGTPQPASALTFAYYGAQPGMVREVQDHVTAIMVPWWVDQVPMWVEAKAAGLKVIWYPKPAPSIAEQLASLKAQGLLDVLIAVYPCDEPDINPCADPADARAALAAFPELAGVKLAVIYAASGRYPGIEHYDLVGVDQYDRGAAVLNEAVADLRARLLPHQRLILVPGGSDPWRTPPQPFLDAALADDKVAWLMPFTWFDATHPAGAGIGSNGMAAAYRAAGKTIKGA